MQSSDPFVIRRSITIGLQEWKARRICRRDGKPKVVSAPKLSKESGAYQPVTHRYRQDAPRWGKLRQRLRGGKALEQVMDLARNFKIDSVGRLELSPPLSLPPQATLAEAVALMQRHQVGYVLICQDRRVLGIFTERDLIQRVLEPGRPLTLPLCACMTQEPVTVRRTESIASALRQMLKGGYRRLPVVDAAGLVVGILSVKRIVRYLVEHFPATIYNLPPAPDVVLPLREGA